MAIDVPAPGTVYELLSRGLDSALAESGLDPVKVISYPAWSSSLREPAARVFFSLQVDSKATDPYTGGGFRVELENSSFKQPALGINGRAHFFQLLTSEELQVLLVNQNRVIASLPTPPRERIELYPSGSVRQQYLSYFEAQSSFDAITCWMRYGSTADVDDWLALLVPLVQPLIERASTYLHPNRRTLGKGNLLSA